MTQNRSKLIDLLTGNVANAIVHQLLEAAIDKREIAEKYHKEIKTSLETAEKYRSRINPVSTSLPEKDRTDIRKKVLNKVKAEMKSRMERGYRNLRLEDVDSYVDEALRELKVS